MQMLQLHEQYLFLPNNKQDSKEGKKNIEVEGETVHLRREAPQHKKNMLIISLSKPK